MGGSNRGGNVGEGIVRGGEVPEGESAGGNCPGVKCPVTVTVIVSRYDYIIH